MRVALGTFAKSALEARVGTDLPAAINSALIHHVEKLDGGRGPVPFPRDLVRPGAVDGDGPCLDVAVDERVEASLCRDAARQGVSPDDLAAHAVLVYLAEIDRVGGPDRD